MRERINMRIDMSLIKNRKHKLTFYKKNDINYRLGCYVRISDAVLLQHLQELQDEYNFDICSWDFSGTSAERCKIKIKCTKEMAYKVFSKFCIRLYDKIERCRY